MIILTGLVWFFLWPLILFGWLCEKLGTAIGKAILWSAQGL